MSTDVQPVANPKWMVWVGWIISVLPAAMLVFSGSMKFMSSPELSQGFRDLGWDEKLAFVLGIVEISCTAIYLIPPTAVLGAILVTGYMGGAIATHVRVGEPFYIQAALGVAFWAGLWLRDSRLRGLLPFRSV